jgi:hypothetical protein
MYAWRHLTNNERARETGVLATEAMLDVLPMQYAIGGAVGRRQPYQSNYQICTAGHAAHSSPTYALTARRLDFSSLAPP